MTPDQAVSTLGGALTSFTVPEYLRLSSLIAPVQGLVFSTPSFTATLRSNGSKRPYMHALCVFYCSFQMRKASRMTQPL